MTNQGGINPLLGKYIFYCSAVRRTSSHEEFKGDEILNELETEAAFSKDLEESDLPAYTKEIPCEENEYNKLTNKIAKGIYTYSDKADYTYRRLSRLSKRL